ncbi:MAG TPA: hypothetical protein VFC51_10045 [Chloroflexota bacterium]|nr:hypothetical protein [Chloroflexota bacterium]
MDRKRLLSDRLQRIWAIVERIDQEPGLSRSQLAAEFSLSERQLQADLVVIREQLGFPLHRQRGYRFATGAGNHPQLDLRDAVVIAEVARGACANPDLSTVALRETLARLIPAFHAPTQPLVRALLVEPGPDDAFVSALRTIASAIVEKEPLAIPLATASRPPGSGEILVAPRALVPIGGDWVVLGYAVELQRVVTVGLHDIDVELLGRMAGDPAEHQDPEP